MKKVLLLPMLLIVSLAVNAQGITLNENGEYEKVIVEQFEGISAQTLYLNTLEALSDWDRDNKLSYLNIDVKDKDVAMIISQGNVFLGWDKLAGTGSGWEIFATLSLKVRCKDGKAQFSVVVPSMRFKFDGEGGHADMSFPLTDVKAGKKPKRLRIKDAFTYIDDIPQAIDNMLEYVKQKVHKGPDDF